MDDLLRRTRSLHEQIGIRFNPPEDPSLQFDALLNSVNNLVKRCSSKPVSLIQTCESHFQEFQLSLINVCRDCFIKEDNPKKGLACLKLIYILKGLASSLSPRSQRHWEDIVNHVGKAQDYVDLENAANYFLIYSQVILDDISADSLSISLIEEAGLSVSDDFRNLLTVKGVLTCLSKSSVQKVLQKVFGFLFNAFKVYYASSLSFRLPIRVLVCETLSLFYKFLVDADQPVDSAYFKPELFHALLSIYDDSVDLIRFKVRDCITHYVKFCECLSSHQADLHGYISLIVSLPCSSAGDNLVSALVPVMKDCTFVLFVDQLLHRCVLETSKKSNFTTFLSIVERARSSFVGVDAWFGSWSKYLAVILDRTLNDFYKHGPSGRNELEMIFKNLIIKFPCLLPYILDLIQSNRSCKGFYLKLIFLKVFKQAGIDDTDKSKFPLLELEHELLHDALFVDTSIGVSAEDNIELYLEIEEEIQLTALSILALGKGPFTAIDLQMLRDFLSVNWNSQRASRRQKLLVIFKQLFVKLYRVIGKSHLIVESDNLVNAGTNDTPLSCHTAFLDSFLMPALENGLNAAIANYQRINFSLRLSFMLLECLNQVTLKKQVALDGYELPAIRYHEQLINILSHRLLPLVLSDYGDVRELSASLLSKIPRKLWPFTQNFAVLLKSIRPGKYEGSALLCSLFVSHDMANLLISDVILLMDQIRSEGVAVMIDNYCLAGYFFAIRRILISKSWHSVSSDLRPLKDKVVEFILCSGDILKNPNPEGFDCHSSLLVDEDVNLGLEDNFDLIGDQDASVAYKKFLCYVWRSVKEACLLLIDLANLSCTEPSFFFENLKLDRSDVFQMSDLLKDCLVKFRHLGSFNALAIPFREMIKNLLNNEALAVIPVSYMEDFFKNCRKDGEAEQHESDTTAGDLFREKVSTTRRSAGLPFLILAILTAEEPNSPIGKYERLFLSQDPAGRAFLKNVSRPLLYFTMTNLFHAARMKCLPEDTETLQVIVHAYNILRAIFRESSLVDSLDSTKTSCHVVRVDCPVSDVDSVRWTQSDWISEGISLSIQGFSSDAWAVRNAALMMFGVLLTRIMGPSTKRQLHDEDDEPVHLTPGSTKGYTLWTFNRRFPTVLEIIVDALESRCLSTISLSDEGAQAVVPPLLILLSRLDLPTKADAAGLGDPNFVDSVVKRLRTVLFSFSITSESFHIRKLAVKAILVTCICPLKDLEELKLEIPLPLRDSGNCLHGLRLLDAACKSDSACKGVAESFEPLDIDIALTNFSLTFQEFKLFLRRIFLIARRASLSVETCDVVQAHDSNIDYDLLFSFLQFYRQKYQTLLLYSHLRIFVYFDFLRYSKINHCDDENVLSLLSTLGDYFISEDERIRRLAGYWFSVLINPRAQTRKVTGYSAFVEYFRHNKKFIQMEINRLQDYSYTNVEISSDSNDDKLVFVKENENLYDEPMLRLQHLVSIL